MLLQLPEDHKLKLGLHSKVPLYAPTFVASSVVGVVVELNVYTVSSVVVEQWAVEVLEQVEEQVVEQWAVEVLEQVKQVEVEVVVQVRWKEYVNLLQVEWGPMHEREKARLEVE
eukprot:s78_g4.t1